MRFSRLTFVFACLFFSFASLRGGEPPVQVLLIGTHQLPADIMQPAAQQEVARLSEQLANFSPQKIVVDLPFQSQWEAAMNADYATYRQGLRPLSRSVREQLGFRVAAQLGHEQLYGLESNEPLDLGNQLASLNEAQARELQQWLQGLESGKQHQAQAISLSSFFSYLNQAETLHQEHSAYVSSLTRIGQESGLGTRLLSQWYQHHLTLFRNLTRLAPQPGERILVLLPSSHLPLMQQLIEADPSFRVVSPESYLPMQ
jgi:hypothetical protein